MNKAVLRKFSLQARQKIYEGVKQKAFAFGITQKGISEVTSLKDGFIVNGKVMGPEELKQYTHLKNRIQADGYESVIEETTYTWFNRFIALRFMEINNYLPIQMRVLSSMNSNKSEPDALTNILDIYEDLHLDREIIYRLQDDSDMESLYQYLLVGVSNQLGKIIPNVFDPISDELALLLPDKLLADNSIIHDLVKMIDETEWGNVEIIGWLYQFYISEQKDAVFANLKKNKKIGKNDIPAATQLFTPRWIVEYMVDNSLGRLWLESHPDIEMQNSLTYYLQEAEQAEDVCKQLEPLKNKNRIIEEIKFLDPCCGSGHILVYAFEVFYKIYISRGYTESEIPQLILQNNLYGLDIDKRAAQLATFAIVMKAREYDRRLFSNAFSVNVHSIEESNDIKPENIQLFAGNDENLFRTTKELVGTFEDAKIYGSIIKASEIDVGAIRKRIKYLKHDSILDIFTAELLDFDVPIIEELLNQYDTLSNQYEVVVTNPPYMGAKGMDPKLSSYVKDHYPDEKSDLFAVFMEVTRNFTKKNHFTATINQHAWMFLSSYEKVRNKIIDNELIVNMVHLGARAFEEIGGEVVQNTTYVLRKSNIPTYEGTYIRMVDIKNAVQKEKAFKQKDLGYQANQAEYKHIPGKPIAYWVSKKLINIFQENYSLDEYGKPRQGVKTLDNDRFLKFWFEISYQNISFNSKNVEDAKNSLKKWFPYNKGGEFRKWYGNNDYLVNWENDGFEMKEFAVKKYNSVTRTITNIQYFFKSGLTWSSLTSGNISLRAFSEGYIFDSKGSSMFFDSVELKNYILTLVNSKIAMLFLQVLAPTLDFNIGPLSKIPVIIDEKYINSINTITDENICLSTSDWNSFENSWDFNQHPFIEYKDSSGLISSSFKNWVNVSEERFYLLKENEEKLNRIFIDIYGLQDELTPEVEEKDITIRKADVSRDVKNFLSYLTGIILGRYAIGIDGLAYAGGEWNPSMYKYYQPDEDNVMPITTEYYFEDNIMKKVEELLVLLYGLERLEENLHFIAEALGKKVNVSSRECIVNYFVKDFYKEHLKVYQKRPIYWLFSSGKRGAFKGLVYIHRYNRDTVARIRTDYVLKQSQTLDNLIVLEQQTLDSEVIPQLQKVSAQKSIEGYLKDKAEIMKYAEVLDHIAKQQIEIDLDDGIKVNYAKFQDVEVFKDATGRLTKVDLLEKI